MKEMICIVCPIGCHLEAEQDKDGILRIRGNRCPRGAVYAREEILDPKRVITATCPLLQTNENSNNDAPRRLPVKSTAPCPKGLIRELLTDIYTLKVSAPVKTGAVLIPDWRGTGIDIVATTSVE